MTAAFEITLGVRDYECDLQGVVNNSVYQQYLEHARHEYLKACGIDFAALTSQGIHLVVTRAELDYKASLTSGDTFTVVSSYEMASKLKFLFNQHIIRQRDKKVMLKARIYGVALNEKGRPFVPDDLIEKLS